MSHMPDPTPDIAAIHARYKWRAIQPPRKWQPTEPGSELTGFYGGKTLRDGPHGQYYVCLVHVPLQGTFTASGTHLIQAVDAGMVPIGHPVRIVWQGYKETAAGHQMKVFEVMVAEGEALAEEALPATH